MKGDSRGGYQVVTQHRTEDRLESLWRLNITHKIGNIRQQFEILIMLQ